MFRKERKFPQPPATPSGKAKQRARMKLAGDYEPALWTRVGFYKGVPVEAYKMTAREKAKDPMGPASRLFVRRHYATVIYAIESVVARRAAEVKLDVFPWNGGSTRQDSALLTMPHDIGLKGATKTKEARFMEKVYRAPAKWWLGLDAWAEHIAILKLAGDEALVEWLRQYKP